MPFAVGEKLDIRQVSDKDWLLLDPLFYYSDSIDQCIVVPKLFTSDGSSIPRFAWPVIGHPLEGPFAVCGFLHDKLYRFKKFDRKTCDRIYREALISLGAPLWKVNIAYMTLRVFGWGAWK